MTTARRDAGVVALFIVLTVAHTWPLARDPSRLLVPHVDAFNNVWALNELARAVVTHPLRPLDGNISYPFPNTLALHDHHFANLVMSIPLRLLTSSPVLVYNLVLLASFILSGFFTYKLVERLTGARAGAIVAGCVFAFSAYRFTHYIHLHLLTTQWLPLALLTVDRFLERSSWQRLVQMTAAGLLLALSSWQVGVMGAVAAIVVATWSLAADPREPARRIGLALAAACVIALVLLPIARGYQEVAGWYLQPTGDVRARQLVRGALSIQGLWTPTGSARQPYAPVDRSGPAEQRSSPGLATIVLAAAGLGSLARRRHRRSPAGRILRVAAWTATGVLLAAMVVAGLGWPALVEMLRPLAPVVIFAIVMAAAGLHRVWRIGRDDPIARVVTYAAVTLTGLILSLGPTVMAWNTDLGSGLLRTDLLPGLFRAPARFTMLMFMGLAVLAGVGTARLLAGRRTGTRVAITAALVLVVNLDLWPVLPRLEFVPTRRAVHRWLAEHEAPGAIIEYPYGQPWAVLASLRHDRRLVNGLGVAVPPGLELGDADAFTMPAIEKLWQNAHPRFVVFRGSLYEPDERTNRLDLIEARPEIFRPVTTFGLDHVYELVDRGRAPTLVRRWPAEALRGRRGLELEMRLEDVPSRSAGRLLVRLGDRTLLQEDGARTAQADRYLVEFEPGDLRPGINAFEIAADYRRQDATGTRVGTTGVELDLDVRIESSRDRATVQVNGRVFDVNKGYLLLAIDPTEQEIRDVRAFNTSWFEAASGRLAAFVESLPAGTIVIVGSEFDVSRRLREPAVRALRQLGLAGDLRERQGWAHAAIGVMGAPPGSALEAVGSDGHALLELGQPRRATVQITSLRLH